MSSPRSRFVDGETGREQGGVKTGAVKLRLARVLTRITFVLSLTVPIVAAIPHSGRVLVVVPPGSRPGVVLAIIAAADGRLVSGTRLDWMAVAQGAGDDFASRLRAVGAILVLDASAAIGCETHISTEGAKT